MKKSYLVITILLLLNCSSSDSNESIEEDEIKTDLTVEYSTNAGVLDITTDPSGNVYYLSQDLGGADADFKIDLFKVSSTGEKEVLNRFGLEFFTNFSKLTYYNNSLFLVFSRIEIADRIYSFDVLNKTLNSFQLDKNTNMSTPFLLDVSSLNNGSFVVYDSEIRGVKIFNSILESETLIAGSKSNEIIDGAGLEASFKNVSEIAVKNNETFYALDDFNTIREISLKDNLYDVKTIYTSNANVIKDIEIASNGILYIAVENEGIFSIDTNKTTLQASVFANANFSYSIRNTDQVGEINMKDIGFLDFIQNDLILIDRKDANLIRINDFKTQFESIK